MKPFTTTLLLAFHTLLFAQNKQGNIWITSSTYEGDEPYGIVLDFNHDILQLLDAPIPVSAFSIPVLSDKEGKLRYYSNACAIWNEKHEMIPGSDEINPGFIHDQYCPYDNILTEMHILLPYPGYDNRYILFHHLLAYPQIDYHFYCSEFVRLPDGRDSMLYVNRLLVDGANQSTYVCAVQHGNGRDWWIVCRTGLGNTYSWYLLTPFGMDLHHTQAIGHSWDEETSSGQFAFSPDGKWCALADPKQDIDVFEVDRCEGAFFNWKHTVCDMDSVYTIASGVNFSPSSRFMYVTTGLNMYQFDMQAEDWEATKTYIAHYDGFLNPFSTKFYQLKSAPDNKMYFTASNGVLSLGVIHQPDSAGLACQVEPHGLMLPLAFGFYVPNIPYFNSGTDPACDSLWVPTMPEEGILVAGPSITDNETSVYIADWNDNQETYLYVTNVLGQELMKIQVSSAYTKLYLHHFPPATYFCYATDGKKLYNP